MLFWPHPTSEVDVTCEVERALETIADKLTHPRLHCTTTFREWLGYIGVTLAYIGVTLAACPSPRVDALATEAMATRFGGIFIDRYTKTPDWSPQSQQWAKTVKNNSLPIIFWTASPFTGKIKVDETYLKLKLNLSFQRRLLFVKKSIAQGRRGRACVSQKLRIWRNSG